MKYMKTFLALAFAFMFISADKDSFIITGKVESIRNDGYITVLFDSEASESEYLLLNENKFIGKIHTLRLLGYSGNRLRYQARYEHSETSSGSLLKAGTEISVRPVEKTKDKRTEKSVFLEKPVYKTVIISQIDRREMVLITSGKFLMGSNNGDEDEYPEHFFNLTESTKGKISLSP